MKQTWWRRTEFRTGQREQLQGAEDAAARAKAEGAHQLTVRAGLKRGKIASKIAMYECVRGRVAIRGPESGENEDELRND